MIASSLPGWPSTPPSAGDVFLRGVTRGDMEAARELSTDPYVPHIGSLPRDASEDELQDWIERQQRRYTEGAGFSFTIVEATCGKAVGHCGPWLKELREGRATAGYSIIGSARGHGFSADALTALTAFSWSVPGLFRISLYIEPWNLASIRTAERAGYHREGLLRSHQKIAGQRRDMLLYAAIRED